MFSDFLVRYRDLSLITRVFFLSLVLVFFYGYDFYENDVVLKEELQAKLVELENAKTKYESNKNKIKTFNPYTLLFFILH